MAEKENGPREEYVVSGGELLDKVKEVVGCKMVAKI